LLQRVFARHTLRALVGGEGVWRPGCTPVVMFSFSNGGCVLYAHMLRLMRDDAEFKSMAGDIVGALFDSCPGDFGHVCTPYKAFVATQPPLLVLAAVHAGGLSLLGLLAVSLWRASPSLPAYPSLLGLAGNELVARSSMSMLAALGAFSLLKLVATLANARYWHALVNFSPAQTPHLFLYSRHDPLVHFESIEEVARRVAATGRPVTLQMFSNSTHVDHMKHEPDRYRSIVSDFVAAAVARHAYKT
jgi:hypothetical protein